MTEVDYGYGPAAPEADGNTEDYGYGDAQPDAAVDYGYGDAQPEAAVDYGYGDAQPGAAVDYGYGDAPPDATDYGYGDAQPDAPDMGYGEAKPDTDYGYGETAPPEQKSLEEKKRPKRRCSVTRFSIEAEACDRPLDYNWNGQKEDGGAPAPPPVQARPEQPRPEQPRPEQARPHHHHRHHGSKSAARTDSTAGNSSDEAGEESDMLSKVKINSGDDDMLAKVRKAQAGHDVPKKKGMLGRIRKRLSII